MSSYSLQEEKKTEVQLGEMIQMRYLTALLLGHILGSWSCMLWFKIYQVPRCQVEK
jgi:hypothetical protein